MSRVIIETDSSQAINLIQGHPDDAHPCLPEIMCCKSSHSTLWRSPLLYISRVCNQSAHYMARLGLDQEQSSFVWFDVLPAAMCEVVAWDNTMF